jgi:hypothetical protein
MSPCEDRFCIINQIQTKERLPEVPHRVLLQARLLSMPQIKRSLSNSRMT